jgi:uncharacterized protein YndB with AHSA1/START domain
MADDRVVTVERVIAAPPERIFAVLADPRQHPVIDGSGMVKQTDVDGPERLALGARFAMDMKLGVKYRMVNEVIEFEDGRAIAWAPKPEVRGEVKHDGRIGGRVWRYELVPVDGGTLVRESWDARNERGWRFHRVVRTSSKMRKAMVKTLENLDRVVTA